MGATEDNFNFVELDLDEQFLKKKEISKNKKAFNSKDYMKKKLATASIKL